MRGEKNNGCIIPVGDADLACRLKKENPSFLLAGERHGKILEGFDMGNSPSQNRSINVNGKTVVHTTSAGTQGIANAIHADVILGGSFVNARATAEYIHFERMFALGASCCYWLLYTTQDDSDGI